MRIKDKVCEHVKALQLYLKEHQLKVYAELTDTGWVNVHCGQCTLTFEIVLENEDE